MTRTAQQPQQLGIELGSHGPKPHRALWPNPRTGGGVDQDSNPDLWSTRTSVLPFRRPSVYAPSIGADRAAFFTDLAVQLTTDRHLLVGGDWNCVLQPADEQQPCHSRQVGAAALAALMAQFNLVDAWPGHGRGRGYTHPATAKPCSAARLDRWLVSAAVLPWLRGIDRVLGAPGDHHGVRLRVAIPGLPPLGQSGWAFPTYILYHPSLLPTLKAAVDTRAGELNALADPRVAWELLKAFVRTKADAIHRAHLRQAAAQVRAARATAEQAVTRAEQPHATGAERAEAVLATAVLAEVVQAAEGKEQRARAALYQCQGERGTRWFHSLAKELRPPTVISHLRVPGGGMQCLWMARAIWIPSPAPPLPRTAAIAPPGISAPG